MSELNREQIIKALECCVKVEGFRDIEICRNCPLHDTQCAILLPQNALALITSQEQRIKELTAKITKWEEECDLRGDMWCKLNEENKRLTDENAEIKANWQKLKESHESACAECRAEFKRLTEENERLSKEVADLQDELKCEKETNAHLCSQYMSENHLRHQAEEMLANGMSAVKTDTVREMCQRIKEYFPYDADSGLYVVLDQIAKEMLEGEK